MKGQFTGLLPSFYNQRTDKDEMSPYFAIIYNIGDLEFISYVILLFRLLVEIHFDEAVWRFLESEIFQVFEKIVFLEFPYFKSIYWKLNTF